MPVCGASAFEQGMRQVFSQVCELFFSKIRDSAAGSMTSQMGEHLHHQSVPEKQPTKNSHLYGNFMLIEGSTCTDVSGFSHRYIYL